MCGFVSDRLFVRFSGLSTAGVEKVPEKFGRAPAVPVCAGGVGWGEDKGFRCSHRAATNLCQVHSGTPDLRASVGRNGHESCHIGLLCLVTRALKPIGVVESACHVL